MNSRIQVKVTDGVLEGSINRYEFDNEYYSFQGIPYAKPPLGLLRFKAPQSAEPWDGVKDATEDGEQCYSPDIATKQPHGSEDCLFINVYTPKLPNTLVKNECKPVMVFFHGGAFVSGSNTKTFYGPEYLIREDIVLVTVNYRLGVLGFLSLEDPAVGVPGNAGFKDMVLALKWIQKNIKYFNGDPNNVTIFGESAGAASVIFLILSKMAKGLFHKAIAQSGSALNSWARGAKVGNKLVQNLGFQAKDDRQILDILQKVSVEELHSAQMKLGDFWDVSAIRPVGAVIEPIDSQDPFMSNEALTILNSGKFNHVPLLIGYTSREGMLLDGLVKYDLRAMIPTFETCVPFDLKFEKGSHFSKIVAEKIKQFYFGGEEPSRDTDKIDKYYKLQSDNFFIRDICRTAKLFVENSTKPVYLYRMSIETQVNLYKMVSGLTAPGACHADDIGYLFMNFISQDLVPNSPEDIGVRRFCKLWTNFAKYGNPNPRSNDSLIKVNWKPVTKDKVNFLDIGEELICGMNPDGERMDFWEDIYNLVPNNSKL